MRRGLASLIGVHHITGAVAVRSNTSRQVLFSLGEVDRATGRLWPVMPPDWVVKADPAAEAKRPRARP